MFPAEILTRSQSAQRGSARRRRCWAGSVTNSRDERIGHRIHDRQFASLVRAIGIAPAGMTRYPFAPADLVRGGNGTGECSADGYAR